LQAEFENYRKRMMKQQAEIGERAVARLVEHLLPVLDNFERAIAHGEGGTGVELALKELKGILERSGLEEIPAQDVAFDPNVHEAVEHRESSDVLEPTVVDVYRAGYKLGPKVLRPAMVAVAGPSKSVSEETAGETSDAAEG
jgi:molecular chaperone GrpE